MTRPTVKTALITGITGQDGAYLAELLLEKGYTVHGIKRRSSSSSTPQRVDHLYQDPHEPGYRFFLHYGDLTDATNLIRIIQETQPDEIYNLAAQSHVQVSFETPEYTANADALGTLRLLEAIRILGMREDAASTRPPPRSCSAWCRRSPSARPPPSTRAAPTPWPSSTPTGSRVNYREAYGLYASQRHPLQPREPPARRDLRHPQDHPRRGPHRPGPAGLPLPGQPRRPARLGPRPRLRARPCGSCSSRTSPTTTSSPPASSTRCGSSWSWPSREVGMELEWRGEGVEEIGVVDRRRRRPPEPRPGTATAGTLDGRPPSNPARPRPGRPPLLPPDRGGQTLLGDATKARERLGWEATVDLPGAGARDGVGGPGRRPAGRALPAGGISGAWESNIDRHLEFVFSVWNTLTLMYPTLSSSV